jgi:hypothetical protein
MSGHKNLEAKMEWLSHKRASIWLLLIIWGIAAAEMTPGFHTIVAGTILLVLLCVQRSVAHFEGIYMLRIAETKHGALAANAVALRRIGLEFAITFVIMGMLMIVIFWAVRHVPILWMPTAGGS